MTRRILIAVLVLSTLAPMAAIAQSDSGKPEIFSTRAGAIRGYDPVAYLTEGKPVKGDGQFTFNWMKADWRFASAENLASFKADPTRYAPQYGGYCAYAMSKGSYAKTVPDAWTVHDGKLYLNYSLSVRRTWSKDIPRNIDNANRHWERFRGSHGM